MARRTTGQISVAESMLQAITGAENGARPLEERLAHLAQLRESGIETPAAIDRHLMERILHIQEALSTVEGQHAELRQLIESLTQPPLFPAVYLSTANASQVQGVLVQTGEERRVVQMSEGVAAEQLMPGDEVLLSHERNFVVAKSPSPGFLTGEVGAYSRTTADGRLVLRVHDEEIVVLAKANLRDADLKVGDGIRFSKTIGLAFEKIETSKGEEYFLESTPSQTFSELGGLDREIKQLQSQLTLHIFQPAMAGLYKVPAKKSALFSGPPGNGKTMVARATANWLATLSHSGRSRFISIRPGALQSMWYGSTEKNYREVFKIAREAAAAELGTPVIMFFDEVDSIGSHRGESVNRIDDRTMAAFLAELDGLENRGNIFVLSATNRLESIDTALLRPGRLGDLVLHFPQPRAKAARAILARHLPADIPYALNGQGADAAREELLDRAVAQLFAQSGETELLRVTLRDGKHRVVRAADLISGAHLASIAQSALERACVRDAEGGPSGLASADLSAAISDFFVSAPRAINPRNAHSYLVDLPQDNEVVRVEPIERKVKNPHCYIVEAA